MKKLIVCFLLLTVSAATFSQQTKPLKTQNKDIYVKKIRNQKTAAIALAGGGAILMTFSAFLMESPSSGYAPVYGMNFTYETLDPKKTRNVFLVIGGAAIAASIPFFISSAKNRKKAVSLGLKLESATQLQQNSINNSSFPSLTLKINL